MARRDYTDKNELLEAVRRDVDEFAFASQELQGDKAVVLEAVKINGYALEFASDDMKADRDVVLAAVSSRGMAIKFASPELRDDVEIVLEAVKRDVDAIRYAGEKATGDVNVMTQVVKKDPILIMYASDELKSSEDIKDILLVNPSRFSTLIYEAEDEFSEHDDLSWLGELDEDIKDEVHCAMEAKQIIDGYKNLDEAYYDHSDNPDVILCHIGYGLEFASPELRANKEVVLKAVALRSGSELQYVSPELQRDEDILLAVISDEYFDLDDYSGELREIISSFLERREKSKAPHTANEIAEGIQPTESSIKQVQSEMIAEQERTTDQTIDTQGQDLE